MMSKNCRRRDSVVAIRVWYAETSENIPLGGFHSLGIGIAVMIEACQMQDAMHD